KIQRRDHTPTENHEPTESGTWAWHHQRPLRRYKDEITHKLRSGHEHEITHQLRAGHGRGTINVVKEGPKTRTRTF
ncbi:hypothetical protein BDR04DRAFT_1093851, partial [Suillus decipiens]